MKRDFWVEKYCCSDVVWGYKSLGVRSQSRYPQKRIIWRYITLKHWLELSSHWRFVHNHPRDCGHKICPWDCGHKKYSWDCGQKKSLGLWSKNFSDHILLVALDVFPWSELEASLLWCNLKCIYSKNATNWDVSHLKSISQPMKRLIRAP